MNQRTHWKPLTLALLVGWCLLFLRCETTDKSMVRVLYLAQTGQKVTAALWYQAPEASADASEASAALQMAYSEADTLQEAIFSVQAKLPQAADYRLCDYLLIPQGTDEALLAEYEQLVLERQCGRTAARVACAAFDPAALEELAEPEEELSDKLLQKLEQASARMPRLYQHREEMLLPQLEIREDGPEFSGSSVFRTPESEQELDAETAEMILLLKGTPGVRTFWLDGCPVRIRRCSVSVTLRGTEALLRLDCQVVSGEPELSERQKQQLSELSCQAVKTFWEQGTDLLCLQQRSALQNGMSRQMTPTKNACPDLRTDVRFLQF